MRILPYTPGVQQFTKVSGRLISFECLQKMSYNALYEAEFWKSEALKGTVGAYNEVESYLGIFERIELAMKNYGKVTCDV